MRVYKHKCPDTGRVFLCEQGEDNNLCEVFARHPGETAESNANRLVRLVNRLSSNTPVCTIDLECDGRWYYVESIVLGRPIERRVPRLPGVVTGLRVRPLQPQGCGLEPVNDADVRRVLARVHVAATNRQAIRAVFHALRGGYRWPRTMDRHQRRYLVAAAIQHHAEHRHTFAAVMSGRLNRPEPAPRYWFERQTRRVIVLPEPVAKKLVEKSL